MVERAAEMAEDDLAVAEEEGIEWERAESWWANGSRGESRADWTDRRADQRVWRQQSRDFQGQL